MIQSWYVTWYWYELIVWISVGPAIWRNSFAILEIFFCSSSFDLLGPGQHFRPGMGRWNDSQKIYKGELHLQARGPFENEIQVPINAKGWFSNFTKWKRSIYSDKEWNKGRPLGEIRLRLILIIQVQLRFLDSLFIAVPRCFVAKHKHSASDTHMIPIFWWCSSIHLPTQ